MGIILYMIVFISLMVIVGEAIRFPLFETIRSRQNKIATKSLNRFLWAESKRERARKILDERETTLIDESIPSFPCTGSNLDINGGDYLSDVDLGAYSSLLGNNHIRKIKIKPDIGDQIRKDDVVLRIWIDPATDVDEDLKRKLSENASNMIISHHDPIFFGTQYLENGPFFHYFEQLRMQVVTAIENGNSYQIDRSFLMVYNLLGDANQIASSLEVHRFPPLVHNEFSIFFQAVYNSYQDNQDDQYSEMVRERAIVWIEKSLTQFSDEIPSNGAPENTQPLKETRDEMESVRKNWKRRASRRWPPFSIMP